MRFACLLVEHLPVRVEELLNHKLASKPVVIIRDWDDRVFDASPEVIGGGVTPGDSRRRVEQLRPQAVLIQARENVYRQRHEALKATLASFANAIEAWDLGEFFIDVSALARSFPSEKALGLHIAVQAQRDTHLLPCVGIAANKFTAARAAREAAKESSRTLVVPDGHERQFLAPLPLTALPDPPIELLRRLHLFGITTLGGFAQLPHAAVAAQFGSELAIVHDLARGIDPRPLAPQSPPPMMAHTLRLPEPIADRHMALTALEHLAGQMARDLDKAGYHAVAMSLAVLTGDGQEHTVGGSIKPPSSDAGLLRRMAGRLLGKLSFSAEVTRLTLTAYPLREWHLGARQLTLFEETLQPKIARIQEVLRLLRQRFGETVIRLASIIGPPVPIPIRVHAQPDGTPSVLSWGGWSRPVERVYEYWRDMKTWWSAPIERDYYQVVVVGETVFTVFRDGKGRWFLDRQRG
jgi:nucleotidyltransferase/DNA polymerase involved in DNA repair